MNQKPTTLFISIQFLLLIVRYVSTLPLTGIVITNFTTFILLIANTPFEKLLLQSLLLPNTLFQSSQEIIRYTTSDLIVLYAVWTGIIMYIKWGTQKLLSLFIKKPPTLPQIFEPIYLMTFLFAGAFIKFTFIVSHPISILTFLFLMYIASLILYGIYKIFTKAADAISASQTQIMQFLKKKTS